MYIHYFNPLIFIVFKHHGNFLKANHAAIINKQNQ